MKLFAIDTSLKTKLETFWKYANKGAYRIVTRGGQLEPFRPNGMQKGLFNAIYQQALDDKPIRIIVLKARKGGCSTFFQVLFFFLCQHTHYARARTIAHTEESTDDIHRISVILARELHFEPKPVGNSENPLKFAHGGEVSTRTAGGKYVSSGATIPYQHMSELAKWSGDKSMVVGQLASIFGSVPQVPDSIIVIESTANMRDVSGEFRERWIAAKAGLSPYLPFFSPWHDEPSYSTRLHQVVDKTDYEKWLQSQFKLTENQLQWRRDKIAGDFNGDEVLFRQEFPATEEEAFQSPEGLVFPTLCERNNNVHYSPDWLVENGFAFYRAIDFGGSDPFVCLWVAHRPGTPALTIDKAECPNTWREMTAYGWGKSGRPEDKDDHTCDCVRYAVMHNEFTGHVHVFRELYEPRGAAHGRSVLDQAQTILRRSEDMEVSATVCDRSQPGTIVLLNQQMLPACGNRKPSAVSDRGEKVDGINRLQALIMSTVPLIYPPAPDSLDRAIAKILRKMKDENLLTGVDSSEMRVRLAAMAREDESALDPIYGAMT